MIGGGAAAFVFAQIYGSPERYLSDAMSKAISSENVIFEIQAPEGLEQYGVKNAKLRVGRSLDGVGASLSLNYVGSENVDINADLLMSKNGKVYFRETGLKDLPYDQMVDVMKTIMLMSGNNSYANSSDIYVSSGTRVMLGKVLAEKYDGIWIESNLSTFLPSDTCASKAIDMLFSKQTLERVADLYKNNAFLTVNKDADISSENGLKFISVKYDDGKITSFGEAIKNDDAFKAIRECSEKTETKTETKGSGGTKCRGSSTKCIDPITVEDEEQDSSNAMIGFYGNMLKNMDVSFGIKPWSHELAEVRVYAPGTTDGLKMKVSFDKPDFLAEPTSSNMTSYSVIEKALPDYRREAVIEYYTEYCIAMNNLMRFPPVFVLRKHEQSIHFRGKP